MTSDPVEQASRLFSSGESPEPQYEDTDTLRQRLASLDRRVRRIALLRGAGQTALTAAICSAAVMSLDLAIDLPTSVRIGLLIVSAGVVLVTAWRTMFRAWNAQITVAELAAVVERQFPQLGEQLISAVEVDDERKPERFRGSPHMRSKIRREAIAAIEKLDFNSAVSPRRATHWSMAGSAAVVLLLLPFFVAASDYTLLWERFLRPWKPLDSVIGYDIQIDAPSFAARGSDVSLRARIARRGAGVTQLRESVELEVMDNAGRQTNVSMVFDPGSREFIARMSNVERSFDVRVMAGRSTSDRHRVEVVDGPAMERFTADLVPPTYTQLPPSSFESVPTSLTVVEGTQLTLHATFNKPIERAELRGLDGTSAQNLFALADDKRSGEITFIAKQSSRFAMLLVDRHGLTTEDAPRELMVTPDRPPTLFVSLGDEFGPVTVRPDGTLRTNVHAADDFGVASLALVADLPGGTTRTIEPDPIPSGTREVATVLEWSLEPLNLSEGSAFKFRIRARDHRPHPGPNETWSPAHFVIIDKSAPPLEGDPVARRQDQLKRRLAEIRTDVERTREEISRNRPAEDIEKEKSAEISADDWSRLVREQSETANRLQGLALELAERPLFVQMADEARGIAEQEIRTAARRMAGAGTALQSEKSRATGEAVERLGTARDRLLELERRFDELAATERDLLRLPQLARRAEELASATRTLADQQQTARTADDTAKDTTAPEAADRNIEPLRAERDELSRDVQSLFKEHTALLDAARRMQIDRLADLARQLELLAEREQQLAQAIEEDASGQTEPDAEASSDASRLQVDLQLQVRSATRAATEILNRAGGDAPSAGSAVAIVRQVDAAAQQAWAGRLAQAEEDTRQAAQAARTLAATLQADEEAATFAGAAKELSTLAARLDEIADSASRLSASPAARQAARTSGQRMLRQQTMDVARGLEQIAESLGEEPLRLEAIHQSAHQADLAARSAGELMNQVVTSIDSADRSAGMNGANRAAAELAEAARWARDGAAAGQGIAASSPENIAGPLAEAARQLQEAGRELSQRGNADAARGAGQNSDSADDSARAEDEATGRDDALSRSASALDRSARALTQAANNAKRGGMPQPGSDTGANSAGSSESTTLSGSAGTGAWGLREVEQLEAELERHASRDWGSVPRPEQRHLHEPGRDVPRGEYSKAIEQYFRQLAEEQ